MLEDVVNRQRPKRYNRHMQDIDLGGQSSGTAELQNARATTIVPAKLFGASIQW